MNKFVISNKQNTTPNLDENITNEQEIHQKDLEDNEKEMLEELEYKILNSQFASQRVRKIYFK